ncbi:TIGR01777 family oxidoreductase [Pseudoalteromonas spongiae]|uniref:TIGR01777 family oxidoreductase n=1 Tax=Pseudoalteromonas spongiae TaxID=298657 RepID=UPI000C2D5A28|nr:TIGR01777 family oxidoreductase [Pseudoalteromonas spongiae]
MNILITGATGLIGSHLCKHLANHHKLMVLTRKKEKAFTILGHHVNAFETLDDIDFNHLDVVINLAGEPIADKRWSKTQKQKIESSRWHITEQITDKINAADNPPHTFISGSAIGYYGRQTEPVDEQHNQPFSEYSHYLCKQWEALANKAQSDKTRVCILRTGVVLAKHGGALKKMVPPFQFCLGGPIADGTQQMSWIHINDMVNIILFLIENESLSGVFNATAPNPVSNNQFSESLSETLEKPNFFRMPEFVLRLMFGEMADLLVFGQAVKPKALQEADFKFHFPHLKPALENILGGR